MDLRSEIVMEINKSERVYRFCLPVGAPFGEAHDVAHEIIAQILEMAKQSADSAKSKVDSEKQVINVETNA